jgi:hypothetical protein
VHLKQRWECLSAYQPAAAWSELWYVAGPALSLIAVSRAGAGEPGSTSQARGRRAVRRLSWPLVHPHPDRPPANVGQRLRIACADPGHRWITKHCWEAGQDVVAGVAVDGQGTHVSQPVVETDLLSTRDGRRDRWMARDFPANALDKAVG